MKHIYRIPYKFFLLLGVAAAVLSACTPRIFVNDEQTLAEAQRHLQYLASDELRGRDTPSPGLDSAAEYIASQFKSYGLEPVNGSYFHTYYLSRVNLERPNRIVVHVNDVGYHLALKTDFIPFDVTSSTAFEQEEVVFVGYGIVAPQYNWNDYEGVDVKGKVVVALSGEPDSKDSTFFRGKAPTRFSFTRTKIQTARKQGAKAFILINDPVHHENLTPTGSMFPSLNNLPDSLAPIVFHPLGEAQMAAVHAGANAANALFGSVLALKDWQQRIDAERKPQSKLLEGKTLTMVIRIKTESIPVRNVVGVLPGRNAGYSPGGASSNTALSALPQTSVSATEKPGDAMRTIGEHIVIGGHYDHVGIHADSAKPGQDSICNGADDNASGTTGVLLAARALAHTQPKRSALFVCFSSEEKGLLGSQALVNDYPYDIQQCVAMLNMDMIGRNSEDSLFIGGQSRSPSLVELNKTVNATLPKPFTLAYNIEEYFFRSDQANFALKRIPVLFYFSGMHDDYHKPGDEISKIRFPKLLRAAQLCTETAWQLLNMDTKPEYVRQRGDD